jgi:hypothetical protein
MGNAKTVNNAQAGSEISDRHRSRFSLWLAAGLNA